MSKAPVSPRGAPPAQSPRQVTQGAPPPAVNTDKESAWVEVQVSKCELVFASGARGRVVVLRFFLLLPLCGAARVARWARAESGQHMRRGRVIAVRTPSLARTRAVGVVVLCAHATWLQIKGLSAWVNSYLAQSKNKEVTKLVSLEKDFQNGVKLLQFVEMLVGKKMRYDAAPKMKIQ